MAQPPCLGATISILSPSASLVVARARAGTKCPFNAVATTASAYSSASSAAASVAAPSSSSAPLTMIFMSILQAPPNRRSRLLRKSRRKQKAMTIKAVEKSRCAPVNDTRHIVGKGGAHVGAHFNDLRFAKGWMQRVGGAQQFDRRTRGDRAARRAFDHRRAHHEQPVAARNDIERNARMQETDRTRERDLLRA